MTMTIPDVQSRPDYRDIALDEVGISELRWPINVMDRAGGRQNAVATIRLAVDLPREYKGTHLSRFIEVFEIRRWGLSLKQLAYVLEEIRDKQNAQSAHAEVHFAYFVMKKAPVTDAYAPMDYEATFLGTVNGGKAEMRLRVAVPVTSVCPCSKEISKYGAHNQRGLITVEVDSGDEWVWIEELIDIAEASASCPVYPLLKRPDEKYVTERAYENPVFVEDMARNVARTLIDDGRFLSFKVEAENDESIHNHNAFARVKWERP